jgi:hypothetical protein
VVLLMAEVLKVLTTQPSCRPPATRWFYYHASITAPTANQLTLFLLCFYGASHDVSCQIMSLICHCQVTLCSSLDSFPFSTKIQKRFCLLLCLLSHSKVLLLPSSTGSSATIILRAGLSHSIAYL